MTLQQFLLAFTFVYGVIRLLTFTKLFDNRLAPFIDSIQPWKNTIFLNQIDTWIFYACLIYQSYYWLFKIY